MSNDGEALPAEKSANPVTELLRPIRWRLRLAAVLAASGAMLGLLPLACIAWGAERLLTSIQSQVQQGELARVIALGLFALLLGMLLIGVAEWLAHQADSRLTSRLRLTIMRHLSRVPLGWFDTQASGQVKQAMQDDLGTLHSLTAHFYTTLGRASGALLFAVLYLLAVDWRMACLSLLPLPLFFLFLKRAMASSSQNIEAFATGMGRIDSAVVEFVNGIAPIKAFAGDGRALSNYRAAVEDFAGAFTDFTRPLVAQMANANAMIAPVTVLGLTLAWGTLLVSLGWISPIQVLPFVLVAPGLCGPLLLLHYITHDLNNATAAAGRVRRLLDTPLLVQPMAARQPADSWVCFEQVSHAYDDGHPVLADISFTLEPGTTTAIVGPSGAGKSTLARLLLRFQDPGAGRITLGGVDLKHMETAVLYQHIGFVLQEVQLLQTSVRANLALGCPTASQAQIESAARLANIHERILALPRGYDSVIGEDACLSGGEQQRMSIARAVLLDPPLLVLDEPTAALDAENQVEIQQALSSFARGRTLLVIAHQLASVMHAQQILVVEGGRIVERGRHAELLVANGLYARLWALESAPASVQEASLC